MSIYSIADLRAQAPKDLQSLDDVGLIKAFSERTGKDPMQVAEYLGYRQQQGMGSARISAGVDNYQAGLLGVGEAVAGELGVPGVAQYFGQRRQANELDAQIAQRRAQQLGAVDDWRDVDGVGSGLNYLGGLGAQSLPYLGEAVVGGLTGGMALTGTAARLGLQGTRAANAARTAGAVGASYPSAVGDILQNQRDENGTTDLGSAAVGGVPYAALNAFGIEGLAARGLKPLAKFDGNMLARMGKQAGTTSLAEGASETGQEMINQGFGRMAVNPDETLFNDEANSRYLDSFVGGAALGGAFGSLGGIRNPNPKPVDEGNKDLLGEQTPTEQAPLGIGFSGYNTGVGEIIGFPDGSSMLRSEWEQLVREGRTPDLEAKYPGFLRQYGQEDGPMFGASEQAQPDVQLGAQPGQYDLFNPNGTPTYGADAGTPNLVTQLGPLQQRIDQNLGIGQPGFAGKNYPQQFQAAAAEPTNAFAIDPETGMERRLDIGQLTAAQAPDPQGDAIRQAAAKETEQRNAALADLVDMGADGKPVVRVNPRALTAHTQMSALRDAGVMSQDAFVEQMGKLRSAIEADDKKTVNAIAKQAQENYAAYQANAQSPVQLGTTGNNPGTPQPAASTQTAATAAPAATPAVPSGSAPAVTQNNAAVSREAKAAWEALRQSNKWMPAAETLAGDQVSLVEELAQKGYLTAASAKTVVETPPVKQRATSRSTLDEVESNAAVEFRKNFADALGKMPDADRALVESWFGVTQNEDGELETRPIVSGEALSKALPNSKTGGTGMSREAVRKRIRAILKEAGAPADVSPKKMRTRLGFQVAGTDLDTMERNMDGSDTDTDGDTIANEATGESEADNAKDTDPSYEMDLERRVAGAEPGSLLSALADDLKFSRVLESDIGEAMHMAKTRLGRDLSNSPVSLQAEAVRHYARARVNGDPLVAEIKGELDAKRKAAEGVQPATGNTEAVRGGPEKDGGDGAVAGDATSDQDVGQVPKAPSQAPVKVEVKKKRQIVKPDAADTGSKPVSVLKSDGEQAVVDLRKRLSVLQQLKACLAS